jgi:hypothetical protein
MPKGVEVGDNDVGNMVLGEEREVTCSFGWTNEEMR